MADALKQWLDEQRQKVPDGSATAKAIDYSRRRWAALARYLDDGELPIDNNWVENQIRPIALGRSNWLFAGSLRAGKRAAAAMSLLHSARINGHDPYAYLRDVLERLPLQPASRYASCCRTVGRREDRPLPRRGRRRNIVPMSQEIDLQEHVRAVLEIGGSLWGTASLLIPLAAKHAPESFVHLVPEDVQLVMREDCANPPDSIDGLFIFESSNYRPSFFEGLTEEEVAQKIECERRARKQERLTGMRAVKQFFDAHPLPPRG